MSELSKIELSIQEMENNERHPGAPRKSLLYKLGIMILEWLDLLSFFIMALWVVLCLRFFVFSPFSVVGISMEPTFQSNDFVIIDKVSSQKMKLEEWSAATSWGIVQNIVASFSHALPSLHRGDVVVFVPPGKDIHYIKRIIGLPGETINIKDNKISICKTNTNDCFDLEESYIPDTYKTLANCGITEFVVDNWLFVMWDNREHSTDSRCCFTIGCYGDQTGSEKWYVVPYDYIIWKVRARIIPNFTKF